MIGVFDSGFGGLTILKSIRERLPQYDYLYLGDNARAPYGTRSFEIIYEYTWQCVQHLFAEGCTLVILACNTASAKALRTIQQRNLPTIWEKDSHDYSLSLNAKDAKEQRNAKIDIPFNRRVLGVIRPTVEVLPTLTKTKHIGIVATKGTVVSESYPIEIQKIDSSIQVTQQACPMWVPLIENNEHNSAGADYFVQKYIDELLSKDAEIDTLILGCTHYPLLMDKIRQYTPEHIQIVSQGSLVADSLADYLIRHPEIEQTLSKGSVSRKDEKTQGGGSCRYLTTESSERFSSSAGIFIGEEIHAEHIEL